MWVGEHMVRVRRSPSKQHMAAWFNYINCASDVPLNCGRPHENLSPFAGNMEDGAAFFRHALKIQKHMRFLRLATSDDYDTDESVRVKGPQSIAARFPYTPGDAFTFLFVSGQVRFVCMNILN